MKNLLLATFLLLFVPSLLISQTKGADLQKVISSTFADLDKNNQYSSNLNQADMNVLPIGVKQTIGNNEFSIAVSSIKLLKTHAELTIFGRMVIQKKNTTLFFAAQGIKYSYSGSFIGDASLALLNDVKVPVGKSMDLVLKGGFDNTNGRGDKSKTYISIECAGFKELSVMGELHFSDSMLVQVKPSGEPTNKPVVASFQTIVRDWDNLLVDINLPAFQVKGLEGFIFESKKAVFDFSDHQNSSNVKFPTGYKQKYLVSGHAELWRGVYVDDLSLTFPKEFSNEEKRTSIEVQQLLIDENGISGHFEAKNLIPIEVGNASGWAFSVDDFILALEAHRITEAGFGGLISLPVSEKGTTLGYKAIIGTGGKYVMNVSLNDSIQFEFLAAQAILKENSYIKLESVDGKFKPEACLNGYMNIGLSLEDSTENDAALKKIQFTELKLSTEAPYFSVGYLGYKGEINLFDFPLSISNIEFSTSEKMVNLGFKLKLNLDDQFISAGTHLGIQSRYVTKGNRSYWKYDKTVLAGVSLNCDIAGTVHIQGELAIKKKDPVYGDGFQGGIKLTFKKPIDGLEVASKAIFGKKGDHHYWYVDGVVSFPGVGLMVPGTPLGFNGFGGGLSKGMKKTEGGSFTTSLTGCNYVPDEKMGLGLKAAVLYNIASKAVKGDASFEIEFYRAGGLRYIGFFGSALFMEGNALAGALDQVVQDKFKLLVQAENNVTGDDEQKQEELKKKKESNGAGAPDIIAVSESIVQQAALAAYVGMQYNFEEKSFHANFDFYVNVAGGILRGVNPNNLAGYAVLHIDPSEWYLHMGTPQTPIGLALGIQGIANVESKSYFMMGSSIPDAMVPPGEIAAILGRENIGLDGSFRSNGALIRGSGFAFGSALGIHTGDLEFLILYANFHAGMGFDMMLLDYGNMQCEGRSGPIGINGWYAKGQAYAYLGGELGVKVNLFFVKGKFPIIKAGVAALLQAQLPNPVWVQGNLGVHFNLLSGLVKGNMRFKFSLGEKCNMTYPGAPPIDIMMIGDLTPVDKAQGLDVFSAPQLTLTASEGKIFSIEEGGKSYRILLNEFAMFDGNTQIPGKLKWNKDRDVVTFTSLDVLPATKNLRVKAGVKVQELINENWQYLDGEEKREITFTTGTAPTDIPLHNIAYAYPSVGQQYYYPQESSSGYIVLKRGQPDLFDKLWDFKYKIGSESLEKEGSYAYNASDRKITFSIPSLSKKSSYGLDLLTIPRSQGSLEGGQTTYADIYAPDTENTVSQKQTKASHVINSNGAKILLHYDFASSHYNTFKSKVEDINRKSSPRMEMIGDQVLILYQKSNGTEAFDELELYGTPTSDLAPLIEPLAVTDDHYYTDQINPILYRDYPLGGYWKIPREDSYGVPPLKAIPVSGFSDYFPFEYQLPYYYFIDFELIRDVVKDKGISSHTLYDRTRGFPVMERGTYKIMLQYSLPGGVKKGSTAIFKYQR